MSHVGPEHKVVGFLVKTMLYTYEGAPRDAYRCLEQARTLAEGPEKSRRETVHDYFSAGRGQPASRAKTRTA